MFKELYYFYISKNYRTIVKYNNMKIILSVFLACFYFLVGSVNAQPRFQKVIGGTGMSSASYSGIIKTIDGGYVATGSYFQNFLDKHDVYLVKFDSTFNVQWAKTAGDTTAQMGFGIIQTTDGGYAIAGRSQTVGPFMGYTNGYVIKLNSAGDVQWAKNIGGYEMDEFRSIVQTADGGLVVAGYSSTFCFGLGVSDVYVVKLDIAGNILWTKNIGGSGADLGLGMVQTQDNGIVVSGYSFAYGQGGSDFYCIKLSSSGSLLWTRSVGGAQHDFGYSITGTNDGGFVLVGQTLSFGAGADDVYVVKLDGNGNLLWTRTVGGSGNDRGMSVVQDLNGNYILAGHTDSFGAGGEDFYVIKLDNNGNLLWTRTTGGTGNEQAWGVLVDTDGGYVVSGKSNSFNGWNGMYIVKFDSDGNTCGNQGTGGTVSSGGTSSSGGVTGSGGSYITGAVTGTAGASEFNICYTTGIENNGELLNDFNLYPNPSSHNITVDFVKTIQQGNVVIFNTIGKEVLEIPVSNESNKIINIENMLPGIYFVKVFDGEKHYSKKLIVEHN